MNFIDAHKIVHIYCGVVARDPLHKDDFFMPISYFPFEFDKVKISNAFHIFLSHTILFSTRTQEEFEKYKEIYVTYINNFIPNDEVINIRKISRLVLKKGYINKIIYGNKIIEAKYLFDNIMSDWTEKTSCVNDELYKYINSMVEYKEIVVKPQFEDLCNLNGTHFSEAYLNIIKEYAKKAYQLSNIEFKDEYQYFFLPFERLRAFLADTNMKKFYIGYEDYIVNHK